MLLRSKFDYFFLNIFHTVLTHERVNFEVSVMAFKLVVSSSNGSSEKLW